MIDDIQDSNIRSSEPVDPALAAEGFEDPPVDDLSRPQTAVGYYNLGNLRSRRGQLTEAIEAYTIAIEHDPQLAHAYNNRGNVRRRLGDEEGALADYGRAVVLQPALAHAHNNRGNARRRLGAVAESVADYNEALRLDPELYLVYNNRGNAFAELGNYDAALDNYRQALEFNPNTAEVYNNRGLVYYRMGDKSRAQDNFDRAVEIDPEYLEAQIHRSCLLVELGHPKQAMAGLEKVAQLFFRHGDDQALLKVKNTIARLQEAAGRAPVAEESGEDPEATSAPDEGTGPDTAIPGNRLVQEFKKIIRAGNARHIVIESTEGRTLLEIPVSLGAGAIAGLVFLAPELIAVSALAAIFNKVRIRVVEA